jgi:hypothetical protein
MTNLATMLHATGGAFPIMELKNDNNSRSPWTTAGSWFTHGAPAVGFFQRTLPPGVDRNKHSIRVGKLIDGQRFGRPWTLVLHFRCKWHPRRCIIAPNPPDHGTLSW